MQGTVFVSVKLLVMGNFKTVFTLTVQCNILFRVSIFPRLVNFMALRFCMHCVQPSVIVLKAIWQSLRTGPTLPGALTPLSAGWMTWHEFLYLLSLKDDYTFSFRIVVRMRENLRPVPNVGLGAEQVCEKCHAFLLLLVLIILCIRQLRKQK